MIQTQQEYVVVRSGRGVFREWSQVEVRRRIDAASAAWRMTLGVDAARGTALAERILAGRPVGGIRAAFPLQTGDEVVVQTAGSVDGPDSRRLVTGIVDSIEMRGDEGQLSVVVSGRDRAADLVDCSAEHEPGEWLDIRIDELARILAEPFSVEVAIDEPGGARPAPLDLGERFAKFRLQAGETAWNALERAARQRAILLHSDERGRLLLTRSGMRGGAGQQLVEGEGLGGVPVKSWRIKHTEAERFGVYIVRGQAPGSDDAYGEAVALIEGRATDDSVDRYRPLRVIPEGSVTFESAEDRAQWEATFRAARATELEVEVVGWRKNAAGDLWRVNELVPFAIPTAGAIGELLVSEVRFRKDQGGTRTRLRLVRPDAYLPQPVVPDDDPLDERVEVDVEDELGAFEEGGP